MTLVRALLNADDVKRLRDALTVADYTSTGIAELIGPAAVDAVRRNDFRALLRAAVRTGSSTDGLATLVRLFIAGQTEPADAVAQALAPLPLDSALEAGLVEPYGDGIHAGLDLDVYGDGAGRDWWVISDLDVDTRPGPLRADHVLGIGNAATTLAGATIRRRVGTALDIGTGCGVQALHLSGHADVVTGTDLSERALRFAATTAALNGMEWELVAGDMLEPVAGRRFDLVVSNPPFVIGPSTTRYAYRDSGRAGDSLCADLAAAAPRVLAEGGTMQFLANWLHVRGEDWRDRVAGWLPANAGCDAWIVQREVSDPVEYVNLWLRDASEAYDPQRAAAWLDWFDANDAEAVGFGMITIRHSGAADPVVRVEELRQQVDAPLGVHVGAWFDRQEWLRHRSAQELLSTAYRRADNLRLTQEASYVDDDWQVERQLVAQTDGLRWTEEVDPVVLALVSGADGQVPLSEQLAVLAAAYDTGEAVLSAMAVPVVRHLVERGLLLPSG